MPSTRSYCDVSLYAADGKQVRYINAMEARELVSDGGHEFFCVSCKKTKGDGPCTVGGNHLMAVREIIEVDEVENEKKPSRETAASLTMRDMNRNVGITEGFPGIPANRGEIRVARRRIRNWGVASIGFRKNTGNKAVTVVPREFFQLAKRERQRLSRAPRAAATA